MGSLHLSRGAEPSHLLHVKKKISLIWWFLWVFLNLTLCKNLGLRSLHLMSMICIILFSSRVHTLYSWALKFWFLNSKDSFLLAWVSHSWALAFTISELDQLVILDCMCQILNWKLAYPKSDPFCMTRFCLYLVSDFICSVIWWSLVQSFCCLYSWVTIDAHIHDELYGYVWFYPASYFASG